MKILFIAHTMDENGAHVPGDIIDMNEGAAIDYLNRSLALAIKEEKVETEEAGKRETATTRGRKKPE